MLTLAVPDSFSDLYHLPADVLTRIRAALPVNGIHLEGDALISLFHYDNGTFILYPYVDEGTQPSICRIHTPADVKALEMPVTGRTLAPLYADATEAVFEFRAMPGHYTLFKPVK